MLFFTICLFAVNRWANCLREPLLMCNCSRIFRPVCGNDVQTYDNRCIFDCASRNNPSLKLAYEGTCCPPLELCAQYIDPVCDQNGKVYENQCVFDFYRCVGKRATGFLLEVETRGEKCPLKDHVTFEWPKETQLPLTKPPIRISSGSGSNEEKNKCSFFCDEEYDPVCDNRSHTHKNSCKFDLTNCRIKSRGLPILKIAHSGECQGVAKESETNSKGNSIDVQRQLTSNRLSLSALIAQANRVRAFRRTNLLRTLRTNNTTINNSSTSADGPSLSRPRVNAAQTKQFLRTQGPTEFGKMNESQSFLGIGPLHENPAGMDFDHNSSPIPWISSSSTTHDRSEVPCSIDKCDNYWDPLCDSENITHKNECLFHAHICELRNRWGNGTKSFTPPNIAYHGKCAELKNQRGSNVDKMNGANCEFCRNVNGHSIISVCDNANQTHQSICLFAEFACERNARLMEDRILVHIGPCHRGSPSFNAQNEICPAKCPKQYKPVCDTNGLTHPNLCTFQMYNCHQRKMGRASGWLSSLFACSPMPSSSPPTTTTTITTTNVPKSIQCPLEPNCDSIEGTAICDSEGHVHKNECAFAYSHCLAAQRGTQLQIVEDAFCKREEIQGTNCYSRMNCTAIGREVADFYCASDFNTYPNLCSFRKAQCLDSRLEILFRGECDRCFGSPCQPTDPVKGDESEYICDQSGETKSKCEFEMLRCVYELKFGYNITAAYEGRCCSSFEFCTSANSGYDQQNPNEGQICDSDRRTHQNRCFFEIAKCRAEKIERRQLSEKVCQEHLNISNPGKFMDVSSANAVVFCSDKYEPVCASDGVTHKNLCHFEQSLARTNFSNFHHTMIGANTLKRLAVEYKGECCMSSESCDLSKLDPVCDNLNRTHANECFLKRAVCIALRRDSVELNTIYKGHCVSDEIKWREKKISENKTMFVPSSSSL